MKKILLLLYCGLFSMYSLGKGQKDVHLSFSPNDFVYSYDRDGKVHISSPVHSFSFGSDRYSPALPLLRISYLIGANEDFASVSINSDETLILSDVSIAPNPNVIETSTITEEKNVPKDVDYKNSFYPIKGVDYTGTHQMMGFKYVTFLVCPFKYDVLSKQLFLKTNITLHICTSVLENGPVLKTISLVDYKDNSLLNNFVDNIVNSDQIEERYGYSKALKSNRDGNSNYKYLIITNNTLKPVFQNLADWKIKKGYKSTVLTIEEIDSLYNGNSRPVRIKRALQDYYNGSHSGLQYVLLGGDVNIVPARMCYIKFIKKFFNNQGVLDSTVYENNTPADLYYACFDNDFEWNANGNDNYGEIDDSVDLSPEIVVSRISVRSVNEATVIVNRIIDYEMSPKTGNWYNKILMGGHKLSDWDDNELSDSEINSDSLFKKYIQPYWTCDRTKLFNKKTGTYSNQFTKTNLQSELKRGYTFVDITTHGAEYAWLTKNDIDKYRTDSAEKLKNLGNTIITTTACHTNAFDQYCLSEAFIRNADSGILGYLGCSRQGWHYTLDDVLGLSFDFNGEFYKNLFAISKGRFGEAVTNAKQTFIPLCSTYYSVYRWIMLGLNPIGDPEMPVFFNTPKFFENLKLSFSSGTLNVNTGESDCTICVSSTNDSGDGYFEVQNGTMAAFSSVLDGYTVCVTKLGFVPFVATCSNTAFIQNDTITNNYNVVSEYIYAGRDVTTSKPQGEVVVQNGNVELHGKDGVTIKNGFTIQKGATLKIVTGD